jgi:endonuclease/exonuclease/phosphatase family metal-dependent hydrolase
MIDPSSGILKYYLNPVKLLKKILNFETHLTRSINGNKVSGKPMKRKILLVLIILAALVFITVTGFVLYLQFTEYNPAPIEVVQASGKGRPMPSEKTEFTFLTWNIGYAGLGKELDFFLDGGKLVQPGRTYMERYLKGICNDVKSYDSVDFILIQEIDRDSKRSCNTDELEMLGKAIPGYSASFALNYRVGYIPVPVTDPVGLVNAGLCTFSKYLPQSNERHAYDAFFSWPKRLVFLKRCFLVSSFEVCGGKQLLVINLHNSAFDFTGELRIRELAMLRDYMKSEYRKGNYIIAGGDWNMNPRGFRPEDIHSGDKGYPVTPGMDATFLAGWQVVYDPFLPSNRNVDGPYNKAVTGTTVIDFFVISPNINMLNCFTVDKGFENTDHNPVFAKFRLQPDAPGLLLK